MFDTRVLLNTTTITNGVPLMDFFAIIENKSQQETNNLSLTTNKMFFPAVVFHYYVKNIHEF